MAVCQLGEDLGGAGVAPRLLVVLPEEVEHDDGLGLLLRAAHQEILEEGGLSTRMGCTTRFDCQVTEANISRLFHWDKTYKTGRVTRNGAEVVKIRNKSSDLRPNHFSFDINVQLPPRKNQSSCLRKSSTG